MAFVLVVFLALEDTMFDSRLKFLVGLFVWVFDVWSLCPTLHLPHRPSLDQVLPLLSPFVLL